MGLLDSITNFFTPSTTEESAILPLLNQRDGVGRKSKKQQLIAYHEVPAFHSAINLIADTFASVEWQHFEGGERKRSGPLVEMFEQPNPVMTGYRFRSLTMKYLDIVGQSVSVMIPADDTSRVELYPVPPTEADQREDGSWKIDHGDVRFTVPDEAIFEMRKPDLLSPYIGGKGYGGVLSDELDIIENAATFEKAEFQNNARPDVIVNLSGGGKAAIEKFKQKWESKFRGPEKSGKPLVANGGHLEVREMSPPLKDTIIADLREISDDKVFSALGVPPSLAGKIEKTNRAKIRTERIIHAENNTKPRAKTFKTAWNSQVLDLFGNSRIEHEDPAPNDFERQFEVMKERPDAFTYNEFRELAGKQPREGLDVRPIEKPSQLALEDIGDAKTEDTDNQENSVEQVEVELVESGPETYAELEANESGELVLTKQTDPKERKAKRVADKIEITDEQKQQFIDEYENQLEETAEEESQFLEIGSAAAIAAVMRNSHEHVTDFEQNRLVFINETTKSQIQGVISEGLSADKARKKIAEDILFAPNDVFQHRPERAANTEMLRARNFAKQKIQKNVDGVNYKGWLSMRDSKVRPAHNKLDGQVVEVNSVFRHNGFTAEFPGAFNVPELDINCRCTTRPRKTKKSVSENMPGREKYWEKFNKSLEESQQVFERLFGDLFRRQMIAQAFPAFVRIFDVDREDAQDLLNDFKD